MHLISFFYYKSTSFIYLFYFSRMGQCCYSSRPTLSWRKKLMRFAKKWRHSYYFPFKIPHCFSTQVEWSRFA